MSVDLKRTMTMRGMLRDLVDCKDFKSMCLGVGLVPSGPDVDDREHHASHRRIEALSGVSKDINEAADIAGDTLLMLCSVGARVEPSQDDFEQYRALSRAASSVVISHLVSKGCLGVSA